MVDVKVGTFNVLNLARPGEQFYPDQRPYTSTEFDRKADWIAEQLRRMDADVVGFQEVFHAEALQEVCKRSGLYTGGTVVAPGADGVSGPRLGLATRLPVTEAATTVERFPAGVDVPAEGVALPVGNFSRPVLRARLRLDETREVTVFVVHLKSKRPIRAAGADEHEPREEALGKARALVRRASEAAALRFLVLDEIVGNARPAIVLGDLNDATRAVTTDIVMGDEPSRFWPRREQKPAYWDRVLYSAHEINSRLAGRDVSYTHIFNGHYENLDHVLVSQEFYDGNPQHIGEVANVRYFNDHLFDSRLSNDDRDRIVSDHAQLVAEIRLRDG
ncbi:endonuclease/exonuclease/phosphatase family protein [Pseudonocardia hierapolitana]|uniref:Endonuclease/exonuclease/phosphatase family protein n=1 Tax=Pseudonocardia hierapolitana TaxID=1128676 RepID=A0A561SY73_9PSEU|nr:endonuclease/exonuclease/phosphatase family protein [Pseudonocardia hierapolitana]TWF79783.1 endonuclease/exonuclease/phosphatase family protein [Pseudonocardia hierapolitana]